MIQNKYKHIKIYKYTEKKFVRKMNRNDNNI